MRRIGMTWQVDPRKWEPYKEIHLNPWPELIEALQASGFPAWTQLGAESMSQHMCADSSECEQN